jgi:hypothetical protein
MFNLHQYKPKLCTTWLLETYFHIWLDPAGYSTPVNAVIASEYVVRQKTSPQANGDHTFSLSPIHTKIPKISDVLMNGAKLLLHHYGEELEVCVGVSSIEPMAAEIHVKFSA